MKTIRPATQELILDALPDEGSEAIELMAQLLANMILCIDGATIDKTIDRLRFHLAEYEGT